MELRKFQSPEDLEWYSEIASRYFNFAVLESEAKWKVTGPEPGVRDYSQTEPVLSWGEQWDLDIKGHVLVWGNGPPLSSSGIPEWVLDRFPDSELSGSERDELRSLLEEHVRDSVAQFEGRIPVWDITNETLQPLAQWFIDRLGPEVTVDAFGWADEEDPGAILVMNEWISEVFTGIGGPTAADVRDRLLELRDAGVPVEAVGIQGQFTPAAAHLGPGADVSNRTPLEVYARALDTLAEAGLPIHITEINVFTPEDQQIRAAHLSGAMRLWWGHPAVEQFGFWSLWNGVSGKKDYDVGLYDDDKQITPMGEAVMHLLNDRWRTRLSTTVGNDGLVEVQAAAGDYLVEWAIDGRTYHATFELELGEGAAVFSLVGQ
jgi:GH35 family endo-1,4-beta-xylanase